MMYHNTFDHIYRRPPKPINQAIEQFVEDSIDIDRSGKLEDVEAKLKAVVEVLGAMSLVLDERQRATLAQLLRFKEVPGSSNRNWLVERDGG